MALKRIVVGAVALAAIATGTGYAVAQSSTSQNAAASTPSSGASGSAPSSAPSGKNGGHGNGHRGHGARGRLMKLRTLQHAEWVTQDPKTHKDVTHDAVAGTLSNITSTSVTVKAADGYTLTFKVDANTKVHVAGSKGAKSKITELKSGSKALVAGIKSGSTVTANQVLAGKK